MISEGMYVSCPITKKSVTIYVLGKVKQFYKATNDIDVVFYDKQLVNNKLQILSTKQKVYAITDVQRAAVNCPVNGKWKDTNVVILCESGTGHNGLVYYYCRYVEKGQIKYKNIPESELTIDFYNIKNNAKDEAVSFKSTERHLFFVRQFLSKRRAYINSYENIINLLVNSRIYLYPHQIDTVLRATKGNRTRVMLADEVGLGKTIEALSILKFYIRKNPKFKCVIVVPSTLEYQWFNETNERFGIEAEIFSFNRVKYKKTHASVFIISYGEYHQYKYEIEDMDWDMIVIDEAHKILNGPYYNTLLAASCKIRNVILLSATPIVRDGGEYLRLFKMVEPVRFKKVNADQFKKLMGLQSIVTGELFDLKSDMAFYDQMDMRDSFVERLRELNEELNDEYLNQVIKAIMIESDDNGLYAVKLAVEYLHKKYVIETNVIRHRREEIQEARIQRILGQTFTYYMEGADLDIYESNLYDSLLTLMNGHINATNRDKWITLLEAMHSSPYALLPYFTNLQLSGEAKRETYSLLQKWQKYCELEVRKLMRGYTSYRTRFGCLIEAIETSKAKKILIFSNFTETVKVIYELLQVKYGKDDSVMFNSEMSRLEVHAAARRFQNNENCRFIVCDKSGGEGRNFQKADLIIHFDLSWSPAVMEQRIGRLDRIGRDVNRSVESIVIYANDTVEESIFNIYKNSLQVFDTSLCGLEIIFDELQNMIADSFIEDPLFGLSHAQKEIEEQVSRMKEAVDEEIYFSTESDKNEMYYIQRVANAFRKENEEKTEDDLIYWINQSGMEASRNSKTGVVTIDINNDKKRILQTDLFFEAFGIKKCLGTFRKEVALENDSIKYFSPNHVIYKAFMSQLDRKQRGRFFAGAIGEGVRWGGFVFVWNIEINQRELIKKGMDPQGYRFIKKYLNEQQVITSFKLFGSDTLNENDVLIQLENEEIKPITSIEETKGYGDIYDDDSWEDCVNNAIKQSSLSAKSISGSFLNRKELLDYLYKRRINHEIIKHTVCYPYNTLITMGKAIEAAVCNSKPVIDSILYIEV